jgi:AcrR family transcriptional regulator
MTGTIAGRGDPRRTLRRLWGVSDRPSPAPGPKGAFDTGHVVETALRLAEGRPEPTVSLRALGAALGCTPMALYTYVGSKEELLDLMYDRAHADFVTPGDGTAAGWAESLLEVYLRHPWAAGVSYARPVLGPHEQAVMESLLGLLEPAGLGREDRVAVVAAMFGLVRSTAGTVADARTTAATDARWWSERARAWREVAPDFAERFPLSAQLMTAAAGSTMEGRARAALRRGVELLLAGAAAGPGAPEPPVRGTVLR